MPANCFPTGDIRDCMKWPMVPNPHWPTHVPGTDVPLPSRVPGTLADLEPIPGVSFLGIGYKARHGKNATCDYIHNIYPGVTRVYGFADALKVFCRCHGMREKDGAFLQKVGTAVRDYVDVEHWIKVLYWMIYEQRPKYAIVCDVRFNNEAAFIRKMGGKMCRVSRYNPDGSLFVDPSRPADHPSETELDGYGSWDYAIENRSGLANLENAAYAMFKQFRGEVR